MIRHTEVDGVPAVVAGTTGPMRAGLAFRVGRADETLARSGVTHLVEHLALHPLGYGDVHHNGSTGELFTHFYAQGSEREVAAFLTGVCASLRDLPAARLATEKDILRTEAAGRADSVSGLLTLWRHGARDYGLSGYPEWGLSALTADDLRAWVARYFTAGNAVLWVAGDDIPAGLSLELPAGGRQPAPSPSSTLPVTPAYFVAPAGTLAWEATLPRSTGAAVFSRVLDRMMYRELRQEAGISYTVQARYETRGATTAIVTAVADALAEKQDAVFGGFTDVLATVRAGRIDPADVRAVVGMLVEGLEQADADAHRVSGYAADVLVGGPLTDAAQLIAELHDVRPAHVATVARQALDDGLLMVPAGLRAERAGFAAAPTASADVVTGTAYRSRESPDVRLVIGNEGVSVVGGDERATVRFDACAAYLAWPDGARALIGEDAITVRVEPTLHRGLADAVPGLDARIAPSLRVDRPAREPEAIPQPAGVRTGARLSAPISSRLGARFRLRLSTRNVAIAKAVVVGLLGAFFAVCAVAVGLTGDWSRPGSTAAGLIAALFFAVLAAGTVRNVLRSMPVRR